MKLLYAVVYTDNLEKSISFYRDTIGLRLIREDELFASFDLQPAMLGIKLADSDRERPGAQNLIIAVSHIDHTYEALLKKNVSVYEKISNEDWGRNFSILDPDGNRITFVNSSH